MTTDSRRAHGLRRAEAVCAALFLSAGVSPASAQVLTAVDDLLYVPHAATLVVDAFGVLENDLLDGESAGENGAAAELVADASHGALTLNADGSFSYSPGIDFDGTDQFVYRAVAGGVSDEASVTLSACTSGPQVFTCWKQGAFLAKAAALGHPSFFEGFEDDAVWGSARSPISALAVSSRGFEWRANDFDPTHVDPPQPPPPPPNQITTGSGAARSGQWGIFDPMHGYATGTSTQCDVDAPPENCLYHDGVTIRRGSGSGPLYGAGGFFHGTYGANVAIVLDGDWQNPIGGGKIAGGGSQFFGVIDAGPTGFDEIQFRETDGKVGQALFIFADDFRLLAERNVPIPALGPGGIAALGLAIAALGTGWLRRFRRMS